MHTRSRSRTLARLSTQTHSYTRTWRLNEWTFRLRSYVNTQTKIDDTTTNKAIFSTILITAERIERINTNTAPRTIFTTF